MSLLSLRRFIQIFKRLETLSFGAQDYPGQSSYFKDAYQKATSKTYGYLLVDMNPASEDRYRLHTHTMKHHSIFTERIIKERVILKTMSHLVYQMQHFSKCYIPRILNKEKPY